MTFVILLLVLFIDRVLWDADRYRQHAWFDRYRERVAQLPFLGQMLNRPWGAVLLIALPTALVGWLQIDVLPSFGPLFEGAFAGLILLLSLGPQELGRSVDRYLDARMSGNREQTRELANGFDGDPDDTLQESLRVSRGILAAACRRLIGPLFWFAVFGPSGATAYRLAHLLRERLSPVGDIRGTLASGAKGLAHVLDWAPVRITAAGYAVAGNFDAVAAAWKSCAQGSERCGEDESLLHATGEAALEQHGSRTEIALIEDSLALVWRNLTLWVLFVASIALFSL
jgi:AmpE protein